MTTELLLCGSSMCQMSVGGQAPQIDINMVIIIISYLNIVVFLQHSHISFREFRQSVVV